MGLLTWSIGVFAWDRPRWDALLRWLWDGNTAQRNVWRRLARAEGGLQHLTSMIQAAKARLRDFDCMAAEDKDSERGLRQWGDLRHAVAAAVAKVQELEKLLDTGVKAKHSEDIQRRKASSLRLEKLYNDLEPMRQRFAHSPARLRKE